MAIDFHVADAQSAEGADSGDVNVTKPTNLADDDVLLLLATCQADTFFSSGQSPEVDGYDDFVVDADDGLSSSGDARVGAWFEAIASAAGEPATYQINLDSYAGYALAAMRITGLDATTPVESFTDGTDATSHNNSTDSVFPTRTYTDGQVSLYISANNLNPSAAQSVTTHTGMTELLNPGALTSRLAIWVGYEVHSGSGTSTSRTAVWDTAADGIAVHLLLNPTSGTNASTSPTAIATTTAVSATASTPDGVATPSAIATTTAVAAAAAGDGNQYITGSPRTLALNRGAGTLINVGPQTIDGSPRTLALTTSGGALFQEASDTSDFPFTGTNNDPLSTHDPHIEDYGAFYNSPSDAQGWIIQSNKAQLYPATNQYQVFRVGGGSTPTTFYDVNDASGAGNMAVEVTVDTFTAASSGFGRVGVLARMDSGAGPGMFDRFGYLWGYEASTGVLAMRRLEGNTSFVTLGSTVPYTLTSGDILRIECEGSELRGYVNGVLKGSWSDSTYTGEVGGVYGNVGSTGTLIVDDYSQGPLYSSAVYPEITTRAKLEVVLDDFVVANLNVTADPDSWSYSGTPLFFGDSEYKSFFGYSTFGSGQGIAMTPDVHQLSIDRGRQNELQPFRAGTLSLSLHDIAKGDLPARHWDPQNDYTDADTGYFSFRNSSMPLDYGSNFIGAKISVYALVDSRYGREPTREQIFSGFVDTYQTTYHVKDRHSATLTATDGASKLAQHTLTPDVFRGPETWSETVTYDAAGGVLGDYQWDLPSNDVPFAVGDIVWFEGTGGAPTLYESYTKYYVVGLGDGGLLLSDRRGGDPVQGVGDSTGTWTLHYAPTPPTFSAEQTGDRIENILDSVSFETQEVVWPGTGKVDATNRDIDNGSYKVQSDEVAGNVWAELTKLGETELNNGVFIAKDGRFTFRALYSIRNDTTITFVDELAGLQGIEIKYLTIEIPHNKQLVYNLVSLYRFDEDGVLGGVPESAEDTISQGIFGIKEFTRTDLLHLTDSSGDVTAQNHAEFLRDNYKGKTTDPAPVKQITVAIQDQDNTAKLALFETELMATTTVQLGARGGRSTIDSEYAVDRIAYNLTPGGAWTMTLGLSKAWTIPGTPGTTTDNRVGSATVGDAIVGI